MFTVRTDSYSAWCPQPPNAGRWTPARLMPLLAPEFLGASPGLNLTTGPCQSSTNGLLSHGKENLLFLRTFGIYPLASPLDPCLCRSPWLS